jgi:SAM-dependent methyltransferase
MPPLLTNFLQSQRLRMVAPYLQGSVLDLGCGDAVVLTRLRPDQAYVGVDGRAELVASLQKRHPGYQFYARDLDREPLSLSGRFQTIVLMAVIEHLSQPGRMLSQIGRYLDAGGRLLITTPSPFGNRVHQVGARAGLFSLEAMRDHKVIFTEATLSHQLWHNGLRVSRYRRFLLGCNQLFVCEARDRDGEAN